MNRLIQKRSADSHRYQRVGLGAGKTRSERDEGFWRHLYGRLQQQRVAKGDRV